MTFESIQKTAELFGDIAEKAGWWMSMDGRIGARDVETLLGWKEGTFERRRRDGTAPPALRIGGGGHRLTVRLVELAEWFEAQRDTEDPR